MDKNIFDDTIRQLIKNPLSIKRTNFILQLDRKTNRRKKIEVKPAPNSKAFLMKLNDPYDGMPEKLGFDDGGFDEDDDSYDSE